MLELNEINISYDLLVNNIPTKKQTINNSIHKSNIIINKYIRSFLNMDNDTHKIINIENPIEWTPIKLCSSVNYLLRTQDEFWFVNYSKLNGFQYKYIINIQELLIDNISSPINFKMVAPRYIINYYIPYIKVGINGNYYYLCTTNDEINKYDNYVIKWNNKFHYIQLVY